MDFQLDISLAFIYMPNFLYELKWVDERRTSNTENSLKMAALLAMNLYNPKQESVPCSVAK